VTATRQQTMQTYLNGGGKVFLEHYFSTFLRSPGTARAAWTLRQYWRRGSNTPANLVNISTPDMLTHIDETFDKGKALPSGSSRFGASAAPGGTLQLTNSAVAGVPVSKYTASAVFAPASARSTTRLFSH